MGEVTTTMPENAHGFLLRSHLGETAQTLSGLADDLLGLRDMPENDPKRTLRIDDTRNAIEQAIGELTALDALLVAELRGADSLNEPVIRTLNEVLGGFDQVEALLRERGADDEDIAEARKLLDAGGS